MKFTKLLLSLVVSVMMLAFTSPIYAEPVDVSDTYLVKVEVTGIKEGNSLILYKIVSFKLDAETNAVAYQLAEGLPEEYDSIDELAAIKSDGYVFSPESDAKTCADVLANLIANGTVSPLETVTIVAGSENKAVQTDVPAGWYIAVASGTKDTGIIYQNMLINALPVVDTQNNTYKSASDISFGVKHSDETITKGVGGNPDYTAETDSSDAYLIGDTVPFEIKSNIPNYPNPSKEATFVITDTPTNLTDTVSSVKVTVAGDDATGTTAGSIDGKFAVAASGNGFTVTFVKDYILSHPGAAVTVNYNAVINADATIDNAGLTANNTAKITFNPNPNEAGTVEPEDNTKLYTYGLTILKYKEGDESTTLKGAKFILYASDGTTVVKAETSVDDNGRLTWDGLKAGSYKLVETVAPGGYKLNSTPREITISKDNAKGDDPHKAGDQTYVLECKIPNTEGSSLPSTGGIGTTIFHVGGAALAICAGVLLISKKRMKNN